MPEKPTYDELARRVRTLEQRQAARKPVITAPGENESTLERVFRTVPVGIGVVVDRIIQAVNDRFCEMTGYSRDELVGQRAGVVCPADALRGKEIGMTTRFKRRDGTILDVLVRSTLIDPDDPSGGVAFTASEITGREIGPAMRQDSSTAVGDIVFSGSVADIAARSRDEKIRAAKLRLIDFAATHSATELLQAFLDEAEALTDSSIGFYHFVEADQQTLSLQTWSTHTLDGLCAAEGAGRHYPIASAGVWVDCVAVRKPVIHNDYARLEHRKGLPDGHVPIIRELVVPVLRNEKIVAILGVGNKADNYTMKDVDIVEQFANLSWEIIGYKHAEAAQRKSEEKFRSLYNSMSEGMALHQLLYDAAGEAVDYMVEDINPAYETIFGLRADQVLMRRATHLYNSADAPYLDIYADVVKSGQPARFETCFEPLGKHFNIKVFSLAENHFVTVFEDITERRQAEENLRRSEARLQAIIASNANPIVVYDADGCPQFLNPAFTEVFGWTLEALQGRRIPFVPEDQKRITAEKISEIYATGKSVKFASRRFTKEGRTLDVIISAAIIRGPHGEGTGMVVNLIDISEQKKLERQLRQAQKMESVGRLAGGVAHDYNNMLSVIIGNAELAIDNLSPGDPVYDSLKEILNAAKRSAEITRQLLAFARKQTIAPKVLDMNATVEGMLKMLRRLIGEAIDLVWQPGGRMWPVKMDPVQIDQILANLCVNARDAIADVGKITIETDLVSFDRIYCEDHPGFVPGDFVVLVVSDDGHGMDKATLNQLFEPFFTTKAVGKGTGLGLSTVYGIVKQNEGFVSVYSEPGEGTSFKIYLPRHQNAESAQILSDHAAVREARGSETILLVEDEPAILKMTQRILEGLGYTVLAANTPGDAERLARGHGGEIQLLIIDVIMPGMNGRDLAERLKSLYPGIKSLFMSGYTADVIAHHGVLDEGVKFIQKPFARQVLARKVRDVLDEEK